MVNWYTERKNQSNSSSSATFFLHHFLSPFSFLHESSTSLHVTHRLNLPLTFLSNSIYHFFPPTTASDRSNSDQIRPIAAVS
ncbi:hypothetical protein L6452_12827 [Arctium lappa]|uniref:Uncharacterized protein n=1 Tax=Arctium lappa TaxID=4217 RepID=A0ACB9CGI8_ARCLA|nr:hypothetical protein L6452_12827 [Arctium lappa]